MTTLIEADERSVQLKLVMNPFDLSEIGEHEFVYDPNKRLSDYLQGLPEEAEFVVGHNGKALTRDLWPKIEVQPNDVISLVRVPEGGDGKEILRLVALIAVTVAATVIAGPAGLGYALGTWQYAAAFTAIAVGGMLLVNALLPPPLPDLGSVADSSRESATYGIDGPKNTAREGVPVPVIYGTYRYGGNIVDLYTKNVGEDQYLFLRTILNDGEVQSIQDILVDDQPIANFQDVQVRKFLGSETPTVNDWFEEAIRLNNIGAELDTGWYTYTTVSDVDRIRLDLIAPRGLVRYDDAGNKQTVSVGYEVEYREHGSGDPWATLQQAEWAAFEGQSPPGTTRIRTVFDTTLGLDTTTLAAQPQIITAEYRNYGSGAWTVMYDGTQDFTPQPNYTWGAVQNNGETLDNPDFGASAEVEVASGQYEVQFPGDVSGTTYAYAPQDANGTLSGATTRAIRYTIEGAVLTRGRYDVRIRRTSAKSTSERTIDSVFLSDVGEIDISNVHYAGSANLSLKIKLTEQLHSIPTVTALVVGSLCAEFDQQGTLLATQYSANPAWHTLDVLINELRGAGLPDARIDFESWADWAEHCTLNNLEFNGVFDFQSNVHDAIQLIARIGHAQVVRMGTRYSVVIDRADEPVMLFDGSNMHKETFQTNWLPLQDRANEIVLSYFDREDFYRQKYIRIAEPGQLTSGLEPRVANFTQIGITDVDQAAYEAELQLRRNRLLVKTVTFDAPLEAIGLSMGQLAAIRHDSADYNAGVGGRLESGSTDTVLKLDRPFVMQADTAYRALLFHDAVKRYDVTIQSIVGGNVYVSGLPSGSIARCVRLKQGDADVRIMNIYDAAPHDRVVVDDVEGLTTGAAELWDTHVVVERDIVLDVGEQTEITLQSPLPFTPKQYAVFFAGPVETVKQVFRLTGINGDDLHRRTLAFVQYSDELYEPPNVTVEPPTAPPLRTAKHVRDVSIDYNPLPLATTDTALLTIYWNVADTFDYGGADIYANVENTGWKLLHTVRDVTSYQHQFPDGQRVSFKVVGYNLRGDRAPMNTAPTVTVDIDLAYRDLGAPTNFRVASVSWDVSARVTLRWSKPAAHNPMGYRVEVRNLTKEQYEGISDGSLDERPPADATQEEKDAWDAAFEVVETGTDLICVVPSLDVGYRQFRIRSEFQLAVSDWAVLTHALEAPEIPARVTGLRLNNFASSGLNTQFIGRDASFVWRDASLAATSLTGAQADLRSPDHFFRDYEVSILTPEGHLIRREYTTTPDYTYTFEKNQQDSRNQTFTARRAFAIEVRIRGRQGQFSEPTRLSVSNPAPAAVAVNISAGVDTIFVDYQPPSDPDFVGLIIWASETANFTPSDSNIAFKGTGRASFRVLGGEGSGSRVRYFRYAAYDAFDATSLNISAETSATVIGIIPEYLNPGILSYENLADDMVERFADLTDADDSLEALIATETATRITESEAFTESISGLLTRMGSAEAAIITEQSTRATADTAIASSVTALTSTVNSNHATVVSELETLTDAQTAQATSIGGLTTSVNGLTTTVTTHTSSINGIRGSYGVAINNNGHVSGFSLVSYLVDNGNAAESAFILQVDRFAVAKTDGTGTFYPFEIVGGTVYIKKAAIQVITADQIGVTQLSALSANLGTITSGSLNIGSGKFQVASDGTVTIRNSATGQRLVITNSLIEVYDSAGTLRVRLGLW
jgi:predicted phage tail protein